MNLATGIMGEPISHCSLPKGVADIHKVNGLPCSIVKNIRLSRNFSPTCQRRHLHILGNNSFRRKNSKGFSHLKPQNSLLDRAPITTFSAICRVKSGESEGSSSGSASGESIVLSQEFLEREMEIAIAEENYVEAAKIRDSLQNLREDSKASVLAANTQFYDAFKKGELSAMQQLWLKEDNICCIHPGALGISGYEAVIDSWNHILVNYQYPLDIELREVKVHVVGNMGYVTCVELVKTKGSSWGAQFVTNVFQRVGGKWFICIHHASHFDF